MGATKRKLQGCIVACVLLLGSTAQANPDGFHLHTVLPGDTLESIARALGTSVDDLQTWNGDAVGELVVGSHIRVDVTEGAVLRVRGLVQTRGGESVENVAERFQLSAQQLMALNPQLEDEALEEEGHLEVLAPVRTLRHGIDPEGNTFWARYRQPTWLGLSGPGFVIKNYRNVWGTAETVELLRFALNRFALEFPSSAPFVVGDLSRKKGGKFAPHLSHQTGLDIDMSYAFRDNQKRSRFESATRETMDAEKTWHFMKSILETGNTQYLFVDHKLQRPLYEQAKASGLSEKALEEIFQYPRSRYTKKGIIRHTRGHRNHMHIRFGFKKKYLSESTIDELRFSGESPIVELQSWVRDVFA